MQASDPWEHSDRFGSVEDGELTSVGHDEPRVDVFVQIHKRSGSDKRQLVTTHMGSSLDDLDPILYSWVAPACEALWKDTYISFEVTWIFHMYKWASVPQ